MIREKELLRRIILNSNDTVGKPIIKGTQLTVEYILGLLAHGATEEEIFQRYEVTHEDIPGLFPVCCQSSGNDILYASSREG